MISSDYYRSISAFSILNISDFSKYFNSKPNSKYVFLKSNLANRFFDFLIRQNDVPNPEDIFMIHGDDPTISLSTAESPFMKNVKVMAVNWLGDSSQIQPLPIGIPTLDRLTGYSADDYQKYLTSYEVLLKENITRDIHLYSSFDITTNLPYRKPALLASLRLKNSYMPTSRIGLIENLEVLRRSKYVLSPPGAGPDCFRTWEAIYLGAVPIVLKSHWPFSHLDLPVLIVESFEDLERKILDFEAERPIRNEFWEDYFLLP